MTFKSTQRIRTQKTSEVTLSNVYNLLFDLCIRQSDFGSLHLLTILNFIF